MLKTLFVIAFASLASIALVVLNCEASGDYLAVAWWNVPRNTVERNVTGIYGEIQSTDVTPRYGYSGAVIKMWNLDAYGFRVAVVGWRQQPGGVPKFFYRFVNIMSDQPVDLERSYRQWHSFRIYSKDGTWYVVINGVVRANKTMYGLVNRGAIESYGFTEDSRDTMYALVRNLKYINPDYSEYSWTAIDGKADPPYKIYFDPAKPTSYYGYGPV